MMSPLEKKELAKAKVNRKLLIYLPDNCFAEIQSFFSSLGLNPYEEFEVQYIVAKMMFPKSIIRNSKGVGSRMVRHISRFRDLLKEYSLEKL